jgi:hypothetical protein
LDTERAKAKDGDHQNVTISRAETGFNERDLQIAICKGLGFSDEDTARAICTPDFPTGVHENTVKHRRNTNRAFIEQWTRFVANVRRDRELDIKALNKAQLREQMEAELGTAWAQILKAVREGDTDSAWRMVEHQIGKPSQTHKHEGSVEVNHMVWQPERALAAQERDMLDSGDLLRALPGDVLEAEVIPQ